MTNQTRVGYVVLNKLIHMSQDTTVKPGFVRVFVPAKNKTIRIREHHARNQNFMIKHGLQRIEEAVAPPPVEVKAKPTITKAQPIKVQHGS